MALASNFYANKNVAALGQDIQFRSYDLVLSKYEYIGSGVYASATTKFTPATSPAWTVNAYTSGFGKKNLYFIDDGGYLCSVAVDSNTATYVVFTPANAKRYFDGTTAAALTDAATYQFYILTPTAVAGSLAAYGEFIGYTKIGEFNPNVEKVPFLTGVPEVQIRQDIAGVKPNLKAVIQNIGSVHFKNIMQMKLYGLQTAQTSLYFGSDYSIGSYWEVMLISKNVNNKRDIWHFWKCNLSIDGGVGMGEKNYKEIPAEITVLRNEFVEDEGANMVGKIFET